MRVSLIVSITSLIENELIAPEALTFLQEKLASHIATEWKRIHLYFLRTIDFLAEQYKLSDV